MKGLRDRFLDPLGALSDGLGCGGAARTSVDAGTLRAAVVAKQRVGALVQREVSVAAFALRGPAAPGTEQDRRVAATIQEQHDLAARIQMALHGQERGCRDPIRVHVSAQVDQHPPRWLCAFHSAFREHREPLGPLSRPVQGFERRSGRAEHDWHASALSAHDSQIARRVAKAFVLFERGIVLFVDDDETKLRQGAEHGGARTDDDTSRTLACRAPSL